MSEPYTLTDEDGHELAVSTCKAGHPLIRVTVPGDDEVMAFACAAPEHLAALTRALYEAAGLPAPVILERPEPRELLVPGPHGEESLGITPSPAGHIGNLPGVMLCAGGAGIRLISDEPVRAAIALVDAMHEAKAAPPEPDPAEVEALASALDAAPAGYGMSAIARYLLRAGYRRGVRDEG